MRAFDVRSVGCELACGQQNQAPQLAHEGGPTASLPSHPFDDDLQQVSNNSMMSEISAFALFQPLADGPLSAPLKPWVNGSEWREADSKGCAVF